MKKLILISLILLAAISCTKKEEDDEASSGDGSQSVATLAGTYYFCTTHNTFLSTTYAYLHILTLNSNNTYTYQLRFSDATSCANSLGTGGHELAVYSQLGAWTTAGLADTPSTGTKVVFTVGSSNMVTRGGTYNGNSVEQSLLSHFNGCAFSPSFSTSADDTQSVSAMACSGTVTFPADGDVFSNVVYTDGSSLQIGSSSGQDVVRPGGATFPTSFSDTYIK